MSSRRRDTEQFRDFQLDAEEDDGWGAFEPMDTTCWGEADEYFGDNFRDAIWDASGKFCNDRLPKPTESRPPFTTVPLKRRLGYADRYRRTALAIYNAFTFPSAEARRAAVEHSVKRMLAVRRQRGTLVLGDGFKIVFRGIDQYGGRPRLEGMPYTRPPPPRPLKVLMEAEASINGGKRLCTE